jgi:hypothetical protein
MTRLLLAAMAATLLGCGAAFAQVGGIGTSPLGMTSPLGIGPAAPIAPTGIPLGATELASPGVSPMTSGTSPLVPSVGGTASCSSIGSSSAQASFGTSMPNAGTSGMVGTSSSSTVFDGGGMAGTASGTCAGLASSPVGGPAASASSPTGMGQPSSVPRVGIPLGSTELGVGGLSPMPEILTPNPTAPVSTLSGPVPCPTAGMSPTTGASPTTGMSTFSSSC